MPHDEASGPSKLGWSLDHLFGLVAGRVFEHMATTLHGGELSFSQLNALYKLYRSGPQTIAEIAIAADLSPPAASRMVQRLVEGGLVERREDTADRRQKLVELTSAGLNRLRDMQLFTALTYSELLTDVPESVRLRFAEALEELRLHLPVHPMHDMSTPEYFEDESNLSK